MMDFDLIGFGIPLAFSLYVLKELVRTAKLHDWVLMIIAMGFSFWSVESASDGVHMIEAYVFVMLYYTISSLKEQQLSPGCCVAMFFFSMLIPDLYGAIMYSEGRQAHIGGADLRDGLLMWPIISGVLYALIVKMHYKATEIAQRVPA